MKKNDKKMVKKESRKESRGNTRNRIIESAKTLFASKGFQQTTVIDISKNLGLSEAALYEYFKGKEDLLLEIPDLWVSYLLKDLEDQLFGIKGAENRLRKYLWWYFRRVEQSPLDAKIVYLFLKTNAKFLKTEVYANVRKLYSFPVGIIAEGINSGEFYSDLDPQAARDIFVSTMDHLITRWLLKEMSYSLFENIEAIFSILINGFRKENPEPVETID